MRPGRRCLRHPGLADHPKPTLRRQRFVDIRPRSGTDLRILRSTVDDAQWCITRSLRATPVLVRVPVFFEITATGTNPDGSPGLSFSQAVPTSVYRPQPGWKNLGTVTDSRNGKIRPTSATR
jgi:hypothetical protein